MPIVQGYHVPEIENLITMPRIFNVLLSGLNFDRISTISIYVAMLHDYLDTKYMNEYRINLHVIGFDSPALRAIELTNTNLIVRTIDVKSKSNILELALSSNIDIILDEKEIFTKKEISQNIDKIAIVRYFNPEFNDMLNAICVGWSIPWNFREPIWNASWLTKYLEPNSLAKKVLDFTETSQKQKYTDKQRNYLRNLSNKISQVSHSKQLLDYLLIIRRYQKRNELKAEDTLFELAHNINNYYLLMSSSLDILARLINDVYDLEFPPYKPYSLDNSDFLNKLAEKRKSLTSIIQLKKYLDWMDWLRQRRNLLAHESHLHLTPLIQRKKMVLSEEEINIKAEQSIDWILFAGSGVSDELINNMKQFKKFQIDLEENHVTVAEDIMYMSKRNRKTHEVKEIIFFPLKAIDEDFKMFSEIVKRVINNLISSRKVIKKLV